jgi:glycerol-3-phosphate dehydrogenase
VRAEELIRHDGCVVGVRVRDLVSDTPTEIRGNITVNAGGPWLGELTGGAPDNRYPWGWTRGYNIIVRRRFFDDYGVGLEGRADDYDSASVVKRQQRNFFFAPWRSGTIIGTIYRRYTDMPGKSRLDPEEIESFIREVNGLYPPAELTMEDVTYAHVGVLPAPLKMTPGDNVDPARDTQVVDGRKAGLDGYYAVRGVKYTTAIEVAERLATQWAGAAAMPVSRSLYGGERLISVGEVDGAARELKLKLDADVAENLAVQYGARFGDVLAQIGDQADLAQPLAAGVRTIGAQVLHAVRKEQALHLSDAVLRRTALGSFRYPGRPAVEKCAALMAGELHWDESRKASEIQALHDHYENRGVAHAI